MCVYIIIVALLYFSRQSLLFKRWSSLLPLTCDRLYRVICYYQQVAIFVLTKCVNENWTLLHPQFYYSSSISFFLLLTVGPTLYLYPRLWVRTCIFACVKKFFARIFLNFKQVLINRLDFLDYWQNIKLLGTMFNSRYILRKSVRNSCSNTGEV